MLKRLVGAAAVAAAAVCVAGAASAQDRVEVGALECQIAGGSGFIFGSTRTLECVFRPARGGAEENYAGRISKFGLDVGETTASTMVWGVLAPTNQLTPGALEGRYVGVSAEATAGVGIGANALIGGFDRSIALNPVSLQTQTGVNIAAGIAELTLNSVE